MIPYLTIPSTLKLWVEPLRHVGFRFSPQHTNVNLLQAYWILGETQHHG
jgi:hypothetical protein